MTKPNQNQNNSWRCAVYTTCLLLRGDNDSILTYVLCMCIPKVFCAYLCAVVYCNVCYKWGLWRKTVFLIQVQPQPCSALPPPQPKTPAITFVNAPTISHYLQTSVLSWNRTLSIECCSEISINLVFRSQCHFASIFYSITYVFI